MNSWFVTGTDTGIGKTTVSTAILLAARQRGLKAIGYKPIETGCSGQGLALVGPDTLALANAAQSKPYCTYAFQPPVAPAHAAKLANIGISLRNISDCFTQYRAQSELCVVEGAGGLYVPITSELTTLDLAQKLSIPLLIVAANRLGTINHTLLTLSAARQRGLRVDAVILSETKANSAGADSATGLGNQEQISTHGKVPVLSFPFCQNEQELQSSGETLLSSLLAK